MTNTEKFKKLEEVKKELKDQFIGLDDIIDKIISSITPWYITQDILERPVIVSLWGMTGTGKSSVVKKLIDLLELNEKTISFDCGRESEGSAFGDSLSDKISDLIGGDDDHIVNENTKDFVFIFDEFQYARTIDENFNEISKPSLRPIWNIIDDGFIPVYEGRYCINIFQEFLEDALLFEKENPDITIHINNGIINDKTEIDLILKSHLGLFHFSGRHSLVEVDEDESSNPKVLKLENILTPYIMKKIFKKLNSKQDGLGKEVIDKIQKAQTLNELLTILNSIRKDILSPKLLNCSKSLIFIIGNLDEAFEIHDNFDHDGDADTFFEITNSVSIVDIKTSLKKRFRAEQISRLGNNLIKYPTLKQEHFSKLIDKELLRIFSAFKNRTGINITIGPGIKELLYSEGVCPVQGVRPVFTTINMIVTPILSNILIKCEEYNSKIAKILLKNESDWKIKDFRIPSLFLDIKIVDDFDNILYSETHKVMLQIGELRSLENRKTRYACGIHEAGHAIAMLSYTGDYPIKVIAVDTNKGGSCYSFQKDRYCEIPTKKDFENDIMISLGGYLAEKVAFGENSQRLMGSESDISSAWTSLSNGILREGYLGPISYSSHLTQSCGDGIPTGFEISDTIYLDEDGSKTTIYKKIKAIYEDMIFKTESLLKREIKLLAHLGKYLGDKGSIDKSKMVELVEKYGTEKLKSEIKESKDKLDYNYYLNSILKIIKD